MLPKKKYVHPKKNKKSCRYNSYLLIQILSPGSSARCCAMPLDELHLPGITAVLSQLILAA